jgi:iron only hydrogenase large subunit-like protein
MFDHDTFYHALKIDQDVCTGCSHCMNVCPTEAIRINKGKAILYENRCVDCGECYKACPVKAIFIHQDDFKRIHDFKHRIALVPAVFTSQFNNDIKPESIYKALKACGFTHIFEVELGTGILLEQLKKYSTTHPESKPLISSFCPAILRLIQVKFPSLVNNIVRLKPPLDITALYCRKKLTDQGCNPAEVGVFYITPCAAKIAAIKSPVGEDYSMITGVINMDLLYNMVMQRLPDFKEKSNRNDDCRNINLPMMNWSLTHGEADRLPGRCLAIDEIHNVIEFLEKLENSEIQEVDFLELRACDESCAGGVLISNNRFLVAEQLRNQGGREDMEIESGIAEYHDYLVKRIGISEINPGP